MYEEFDDKPEDILMNRRKRIRDGIEEMSNDESSIFDDFDSDDDDRYTSSASFLMSSSVKETMDDVKEQKKRDEEDALDSWFSNLKEISGGFKKSDFKTKKKNPFGKMQGKKKKKHKEKKAGEPTDFGKEFETEKMLLKNLLADQNNFTSNLQKNYDALTSRKTSNRGVTKNLTDLINSITQSRSLSMQLCDKLIGMKKTVFDLSMKERKELGTALGGENAETELADYASRVMRQITEDRGKIMNTELGGEISEYEDTDSLFDDINERLSDELADRPEEVEQYMRFEPLKPEIILHVNNTDPEDKYFSAVSGVTGEELPEYPLPDTTDNININKSTNIATDRYGNKYHIEWF